jgi:hypothetical protein
VLQVLQISPRRAKYAYGHKVFEESMQVPLNHTHAGTGVKSREILTDKQVNIFYSIAD